VSKTPRKEYEWSSVVCVNHEKSVWVWDSHNVFHYCDVVVVKSSTGKLICPIEWTAAKGAKRLGKLLGTFLYLSLAGGKFFFWRNRKLLVSSFPSRDFQPTTINAGEKQHVYLEKICFNRVSFLKQCFIWKKHCNICCLPDHNFWQRNGNETHTCMIFFSNSHHSIYWGFFFNIFKAIVDKSICLNFPQNGKTGLGKFNLLLQSTSSSSECLSRCP